MRLHLLLIVAIGILGHGPNAHAQRLRIVVGGANFKPYPIAVPNVIPGNVKSKETLDLAAQLTPVLQGGVEIARSLSLVPPKTYLASEADYKTMPNFTNWTNVGASGLIRAKVEVRGTMAALSLQFYDVGEQKLALNRSCDKIVPQASRCIYEFLDAVTELLTGEKGIFSSRIAFVRRTGKGKMVMTSDMNGGSITTLSDPNTLSLLPSWATTTMGGGQVLFTSYLKGNPDLYRISLRDRHLDVVSNRRGLNMGAAVSPDGKTIVFTMRHERDTEIYKVNWDGSNLTRLTDSWGEDLSPTWSPDGKRIAFVSSRAGNPHIYIMGADGSSPKRLTFKGNYNQEPDWSPRTDGQIAFTARDEQLHFDVFLVHPDTGEVTRLTQDEGDNESPSFSPDGHSIVFTSTRGRPANKKIYVMDEDGSNQRVLIREAGEYETPAWGPALGYAD